MKILDKKTIYSHLRTTEFCILFAIVACLGIGAIVFSICETANVSSTLNVSSIMITGILLLGSGIGGLVYKIKEKKRLDTEKLEIYRATVVDKETSRSQWDYNYYLCFNLRKQRRRPVRVSSEEYDSAVCGKTSYYVVKMGLRCYIFSTVLIR